ncbi:phosphoethanolamine transferase [Morganella morganii]|uniref:phosphoethanolamine transferase n=1 Tax=Morganella morganii TaxID=582 RepID=UPI00189B3BE5|nr:phosphoethanolamine transferase [Morganella morganii]
MINPHFKKYNFIYIILASINLLYFVLFSKKLFEGRLYFALSCLFLGAILILGYGSKLRRITALLISIFGLVFLFSEFMTYRMSSFYFHEIPNEIINIIIDTNVDEISSNFFFSKKEILAAILITANFIAIFFPGNHKKYDFLYFITLTPLFLLVLFFIFKPISMAAYKIIENFDSIKENSAILENKKHFYWETKSLADDKQTVVIFLGETHRGDYLHFNGYNKNTTPNLDKENIISFNNAISQGPYTLISTPMILTRKNVYDNGLYPEKSLISAYKEAGFETWYVSYLSKSHIGDNEINLIANEADHYIQSDVNTDTLKEILNNASSKKLIVYKTVGSHYLYHTRYPDEYDVFKPSFTEKTYTTPQLKDKEKLENSYANSILYTIDKQVSEFINVLKEEHGLVYLSFVSDHGTSIYDDGKSLYGGNTKGNYNLALFYWFNDTYYEKHADIISRLKNNKAKKITTECFLDTSLDISLIANDKKKGCSLIDENLTEKKRLVRNGDIYDYDSDL